jgi:glycosyltransferase involved in cell wall biosynthesis
MAPPASLHGARILNLMLGAGGGGLEAMAGHYHTALDDQGARVLSVGRANSPFARALADRPDGFAPLPTLGAWDPTAVWRLRTMTRAFAPTLIIAHGARAQILATAAFKTPVAAVVHNYRSKAVLGRCDLAICVSASVERSVMAAFPGLATALVENFEPLSEGPDLMAFDDPPRIGALGRLHRNKGFDVLLDAAALLHDRGRAFSLTIAGDGPELDRLKAQAAAIGLADRVRFPGWVEPRPAFQDMDVFVSASRVEPFGLVIIEAMAAGVPVVATDIDGPHDILRGGELGDLVPKEDTAALANAIEAVLDAPQEALSRARRAAAAAVETYSMRAGAARLAAALQPLIKT